MVGPTKVQPCFFRSLDSATDSGEVETVCGPGAPRGLEAPEEGGQRALRVHELAARPSVVDHRLDLAAMADDARVREQALDVARAEPGDPVDVEVVEGGAEVLALGEDGPPAQARLEALQAELLEQTAVVADRKAPFGVVVGEELRSRHPSSGSGLPSGPATVALML